MLTLFLIIINNCISQDNDGSLINAVGISAGYNYSVHSANFNKLPDIPNCCPMFEKGNGNGYYGSIFAQKDFSYSLSLQLRAGFAMFSGDLTSYEKSIPILDESGNEVAGEFKHFMNTDLSLITLAPMLSYRLFGNLKLNLGIGGAYLLGNKYEQYEMIVVPTDWGTFIDATGKDSGKRTRLESSGTFEGTNVFQGFGTGGLTYELPLNSNNDMFLTADISFSYGLTSFLKDDNWKVNSFNAGLFFVYYINKPPSERIIPIIKPDINLFAYEDIVEVTGNTNDIVYGAYDISDMEKTAIEAGIGITIRAFGVTNDVEESDANFQIEEFLSTNMRPLLNYIFFEENSDFIPEKYSKLKPGETSSFHEDSLINTGTLQTYYQILNIIGQRMRSNPEASIKLTGCNSNTGIEKGNKALSQKRAEKILNYLTEVWEIDKKRIQVVSRNLPEKNTSLNDTRGNEENRRVEITSENWEIMKPVITLDTILKASPQLIRFYPNIISKNMIADWNIKIAAPGESILLDNGKGIVPEKIDWVINSNYNIMKSVTDPVEYLIEVKDTKGNSVQSDINKIPLQKITIQKKKRDRIGDKRIDKYSLILFDFNSADLSEDNMKIADYIKQQIEEKSDIKIIGYTDDIGVDAANILLSETRATGLKNYLKLQKALTGGIGELERIYDNTLPEGRFYSRTVEVIVETPIKW